MAKYESSIKHVAWPQDLVFAKLSDLRNLEGMKQRLASPEFRAAAEGHVSEEQLDKAMEQLQSLTLTEDTLTVQAAPVGNISLRIIEREPHKTIKFASEQSPIPLKMWIQLLPTSDTSCKMKLTIDAEVNLFIKAMVDKPLKQGVEKIADMLAMIPYGA